MRVAASCAAVWLVLERTFVLRLIAREAGGVRLDRSKAGVKKLQGQERVMVEQAGAATGTGCKLELDSNSHFILLSTAVCDDLQLLESLLFHCILILLDFHG